MKLKVKEMRDVPCWYCDGEGEWRECYGDYIYDGDCGLHQDFECEHCNKTGVLEVEIEYCDKCGEELPYNPDEYGFNDETENFYKCIINECDN